MGKKEGSLPDNTGAEKLRIGDEVSIERHLIDGSKRRKKFCDSLAGFIVVPAERLVKYNDCGFTTQV